MVTIPTTHYLAALAAAEAAVLLLAVAGIFVFNRLWRRPASIRTLAINFLVTVFVLAGIYPIAEAWMFLNPAVDGIGFTLSTQRWNHLYLKPINALGYRDDEPDADEQRDSGLVMVLGDSYSEGRGVKDYRDRFANRLDDRLGEAWRVVVVARSGWDTKQQIDALDKYPVEPDVIVLQYFLNDIRTAVEGAGKAWLARTEPPTGALGWVVDHSYLFNHFYWLVKRKSWPYGVEGYWDRLVSLHGDAEVWKNQESYLKQLVESADGRDAKLIVIIVPELFLPAESVELTTQVAASFEALDVPVLDLGQLFADRDPSAMVVNRLDGHANEAVHAEIAVLLHNKLDELGWLGTQIEN